MSDMSKSARKANRDKANRLGGGSNDPHKRVDASSWRPDEALNADRKTGARPIRSRIYKAGGKIQGDRGPRRVDRAPRASGGALTVHNTVDENKSKLGSFHKGGYKAGGKARRHRDMGGMADPRETAGQALAAAGARSGVPQGRFNVAASGKSPFLRDGGSAKAKRFCGGGRAEGGKTPYSEEAAKDEYMRTQTLKGKPKESPKRTERKSGGRAKGKTNIIINIGKGGHEQAQMPPQGVVRPPAPPPPMPPPGMPPGGPPPGLGGPGGPPPGMPPGGPPPMMRKAGGRAYRTPKDMDAGAHSGLGRLEKTEIQAHKR